jgi:putative ABC transport system ATP-binding protein
MASDPIIVTRELSRLYQRGSEIIKALDSVSLSIRPAEFVCITGPSGSGKSTLLYILGLLDRQTSGEYHFEGTLTDRLTENERSRMRNQYLGFVFQSFHLIPRANSLRNVTMPLEYGANFGRRLSSTEMEKRAAAALKRVGLPDRMRHRPNELSGGQRQRVAIARALVNDPPVLFADEPTGNLDSRSAQQSMDLFVSLAVEGRTILMVTHNPEFVQYATRHIQMRDGRVEGDVQVSTANIGAS